MRLCARAQDLIHRLALRPHPEGGFFREMFRSPQQVVPKNRQGERSAITTIYFLLPAGQISQWHRIASDEIWHYYEGAPLEIVWTGLAGFGRKRLGPVGDAEEPVAIVPGGCWQAARTLGDYTLVGCVVAPGFEFAEFDLLVSRPDEERRFRERYPELWAEVRSWAESSTLRT